MMFDHEIQEQALRVLEAARAAGMMIVTVESCTGGLVGGALTAIAGSSDVVEGGFITYSNDAKCRLGVPRPLIETHGAVSEEVSRAMADAGRRATGHDNLVAVAITGVAGPGGGTPEKPVGLVHFAAAGRDGSVFHRMERFGDLGREGVRVASVKIALELLMRSLKTA